jgi:glycosyltransferase involved in cell wall biosynthesis
MESEQEPGDWSDQGRARPAVSIVVPTYNEEHRLDGCLRELHELAGERHWDDAVEIIIVDDGSRDRTVDTARAHLERFSCSQLLRLPWHTGKGAAVRLGVTCARGEAIAFMDADLATDLSALNGALEALRDAELAIGSRAIPGAVVIGRSRIRGALHRAFRSQVRRLTGVSATDPQCGFKAFRSEVAKSLFAIERVDGYTFDVEILLLAQKLGYTVAEVPVHWRAVAGSHIRILRDSLRILLDCLRVRLRYGRKKPLATRPIPPSRAWDAEPESSLVSPLRRP